jgi:hypothetical protein
MATSQDDCEQLISRFCGSLAPGDRNSFRHAAEGALAAIPCAGEGIWYRTVRDVWRTYFHPPPDDLRHRGRVTFGRPSLPAPSL